MNRCFSSGSEVKATNIAKSSSQLPPFSKIALATTAIIPAMANNPCRCNEIRRSNWERKGSHLSPRQRLALEPKDSTALLSILVVAEERTCHRKCPTSS